MNKIEITELIEYIKDIENPYINISNAHMGIIFERNAKQTLTLTLNKDILKIESDYARTILQIDAIKSIDYMDDCIFITSIS